MSHSFLYSLQNIARNRYSIPPSTNIASWSLIISHLDCNFLTSLPTSGFFVTDLGYRHSKLHVSSLNITCSICQYTCYSLSPKCFSPKSAWLNPAHPSSFNYYITSSAKAPWMPQSGTTTLSLRAQTLKSDGWGWFILPRAS